MAAQLGQGTIVRWSNNQASDATSVTWTKLNGVTAITAPFGQNEEVDATPLERSRTAGRVFLKGFREDASINITFQFDPNDVSHKSMVDRQASQTATAFFIEMPQTGSNVSSLHIRNATIRNLTINEALNSIQSATFDILMRSKPEFKNNAAAMT